VVGVDGVGIEAEVAHRYSGVGSRLAQRLSGVIAFHQCQPIPLRVDAVGDAAQHFAAIGRCRLGPPRQRAPGRGDGAVHLGFAASRDPADGSSGGGVDVVEVLRGIHARPGDE
jgi:hypothetical protein